MQGPGGSEVTLVVERRNRELTFRIRRAKYEVKAVEGKLLEDGVAYVKLRVFAAGVDDDAGEAARSAVRARAKNAARAWCWTCAATRAACSTRGSASPICSSPTG